MKLTIDGILIEFFKEDKNIVDVADRAKINIPALCYKNGHSKGCCKICLVEINGKKAFACGVKPQDGMDVIFDRDDLIKIRKKSFNKYLGNVFKL